MADQDTEPKDSDTQSIETHKPRITGSVIGFLLLVLAILMLPFISHWAAEEKGIVADETVAPAIRSGE